MPDRFPCNEGNIDSCCLQKSCVLYEGGHGDNEHFISATHDNLICNAVCVLCKADL